jgi:putative transcriptional regulator
MKNKLKLLRVEKDWSQANLADEVGVSRQTIISIEKGKYSPSLDLAFKLSKVFGKAIEEIFDPSQ